MTFQWLRFLDAHSISYTVDRGDRNATAKCPFCGEADAEGHDMAISLQNRGWKCWRNRKHRGRSRARLIQAYLRCSFDRAREIAGESLAVSVPDSSVSSHLRTLLGGPVVQTGPGPLQFPTDFRPLRKITRLNEQFWNYLENPLPDGRGYRHEEARWLSKTYNLHYALRGDQKFRIIIPIYDQDGVLVSWTGRSIKTNSTLRYKTLTVDPAAVEEGEPVALVAANQMLLGLNILWHVDNLRTLVICEGPMDALRITLFGYQKGVYGTCLFGLNASEEQAEQLEELYYERRPRLVLVTDLDASLRAFSLRQVFMTMPVRTVPVPRGVKDPGALKRKEAARFIEELAA